MGKRGAVGRSVGLVMDGIDWTMVMDVRVGSVKL
jgi:hypothetical protein